VATSRSPNGPWRKFRRTATNGQLLRRVEHPASRDVRHTIRGEKVVEELALPEATPVELQVIGRDLAHGNALKRLPARVKGTVVPQVGLVPFFRESADDGEGRRVLMLVPKKELRTNRMQQITPENVDDTRLWGNPTPPDQPVAVVE
jgi:hypothetical protein